MFTEKIEASETLQDFPEVKELKNLVKTPEKKREFFQKFTHIFKDLSFKDLSGKTEESSNWFDREINKAEKERNERKRGLLENIKNFFGNKENNDVFYEAV